MTGKHSVSINILEKELSSLKILLRKNPSVSHNFDFSKVRGQSYFDYWSIYFRENWYDFQLNDFSLLSFNENDNDGVTFVYIGSPVLCTINEKDYYSTEEYSLSGLTYEDYVLTCPRIDNVSYLRYDNAINQYNSGLHPANHFHFGYGQNNRVGSSFYFDAIAFVAMVLRQFYSEVWQKVLDDPKNFPALYGYKSKLSGIEETLYSGFDISHDLYLR